MMMDCLQIIALKWEGTDTFDSLCKATMGVWGTRWRKGRAAGKGGALRTTTRGRNTCSVCSECALVDCVVMRTP